MLYPLSSSIDAFDIIRDGDGDGDGDGGYLYIHQCTVGRNMPVGPMWENISERGIRAPKEDVKCLPETDNIIPEVFFKTELPIIPLQSLPLLNTVEAILGGGGGMGRK